MLSIWLKAVPAEENIFKYRFFSFVGGGPLTAINFSLYFRCINEQYMFSISSILLFFVRTMRKTYMMTFKIVRNHVHVLKNEI